MKSWYKFGEKLHNSKLNHQKIIEGILFAKNAIQSLQQERISQHSDLTDRKSKVKIISNEMIALQEDSKVCKKVSRRNIFHLKSVNFLFLEQLTLFFFKSLLFFLQDFENAKKRLYCTLINCTLINSTLINCTLINKQQTLLYWKPSYSN